MGEIKCVYYEKEADRVASLGLVKEIFDIVCKYYNCYHPVISKVRLLNYNVALFGRFSSNPTFKEQKKMKVASRYKYKIRIDSPMPKDELDEIYKKINQIETYCKSDCSKYYTRQVLTVLETSY